MAEAEVKETEKRKNLDSQWLRKKWR